MRILGTIHENFMTFGSGHLGQFNVNPLEIMVFIEGATDSELRAQMEAVIGRQYCTTYPAEQMAGMAGKYKMYALSLGELLKLEAH